jgi:hypothetical protein
MDLRPLTLIGAIRAEAEVANCARTFAMAAPVAVEQANATLSLPRWLASAAPNSRSTRPPTVEQAGRESGLVN